MANVKKDILWRVIVCYSAVVVFGIVILLRIGTIQMVQGEKWLALSDSLHVLNKAIPAVRGNIYGQQGELLATSIPIYELRWDASVVNNDTFSDHLLPLAEGLTALFPDKTLGEYLDQLRRAKAMDKKYVLIKRKATYLEVKQVKKLPIFKLGQYKGGLIVLEETRRKKPLGGLASRTIGFSRNRKIGVGLERKFDDVLGGVSGTRLMERISGGYRPIHDENEIEPIDGKDIYTSISVEYQDIVSTALHEGLERTQAEHGCAVLMDVKTGRIQAIANLKKLADGTYAEHYNYAVGEGFEPGSTFKLFSTLAVLEQGEIEPEDSIDIQYGKKKYNKQWMYDSEQGRHRRLTLHQSFEKSSNVGISTAVVKTFRGKEKRFFEYLKAYGLFDRTEIEIIGEPDPFFNQPGKSTWSPITLPWLSLGYECTLTPLQMLTAYNAIANKGEYVYPSIVSAFGETGFKSEELKVRKRAAGQVAKSEAIQQIHEMLVSVAQKGTAASLKSLPFQVAGKTGTAQIASGSEGYQSNKKYNASFAGYFPASNPKFSCIVVVNKPKGNYYGSAVAVPIFKEIASKVFVLSDAKLIPQADYAKVPRSVVGETKDLVAIAKELDLVELQSQSNWSVLKTSNNTPTLRAFDVPSGKMPNLKGLGIKDALFLLENKGFKVVYRGMGKVVEQSPNPGEKLTAGRTIYIRLGL